MAGLYISNSDNKKMMYADLFSVFIY